MIYHIIITIFIAQLLLLIYTIILYKFLTLDKTFNFMIMTTKQLCKHIMFIVIIVIILGNIIIFRLSRKAINLDFWFFLNDIIVILKYNNYIILCFLFILCILFIITYSLLIKAITLTLKRSLLAMYLFISQYRFQYIIDGFVLRMNINIDRFLKRKVYKITSNTKLSAIAYLIWPRTIFVIEEYVYSYLLIYCFILDICLSGGILSRVFLVAPWFYIYSLIRSFILYYLELVGNMDNKDLTYDIYGIWATKNFK